MKRPPLQGVACVTPLTPAQHAPLQPPHLYVAEVLVNLATDTTVYLSRRGGALKVNKLTFTIRASDSS